MNKSGRYKLAIFVIILIMVLLGLSMYYSPEYKGMTGMGANIYQLQSIEKAPAKNGLGIVTGHAVASPDDLESSSYVGNSFVYVDGENKNVAAMWSEKEKAWFWNNNGRYEKLPPKSAIKYGDNEIDYVKTDGATRTATTPNEISVWSDVYKNQEEGITNAERPISTPTAGTFIRSIVGPTGTQSAVTSSVTFKDGKWLDTSGKPLAPGTAIKVGEEYVEIGANGEAVQQPVDENQRQTNQQRLQEAYEKGQPAATAQTQTAAGGTASGRATPSGKGTVKGIADNKGDIVITTTTADGEKKYRLIPGIFSDDVEVWDTETERWVVCRGCSYNRKTLELKYGEDKNKVIKLDKDPKNEFDKYETDCKTKPTDNGCEKYGQAASAAGTAVAARTSGAISMWTMTGVNALLDMKGWGKQGGYGVMSWCGLEPYVKEGIDWGWFNPTPAVYGSEFEERTTQHNFIHLAGEKNEITPDIYSYGYEIRLIGGLALEETAPEEEEELTAEQQTAPELEHVTYVDLASADNNELEKNIDVYGVWETYYYNSCTGEKSEKDDYGSISQGGYYRNLRTATFDCKEKAPCRFDKICIAFIEPQEVICNELTSGIGFETEGATPAAAPYKGNAGSKDC